MSQLLEIAIIGIFGLFLLILLIAAVAGIVHAIRESVRQHRRPPIFSFVTWGLSLLFFIFYVTTRTLWKTQEIDLYLFGRFGDFWEKFLQGAFFVLLTTATGFYVFTSFRLPPEESGFAEGEDGDSDEDELDEEDREELRRRAAMRAAMAKRNGIMRVLSIALPLVLDAILIGALIIVNVSVHYEHNVTELRSPDGDRIIYVDNSFFVMNGSIQGRAPFVSTYEKLNPFLVAKLQRPSDQPAPTVLDVSEDNLVWKEDRLRVLYGNTYVDYFYYGVTPPEE